MINTEELLKKRILVTGGAGFIGSHIVDFLVGIGHKNTIVMDNLETGDLDNIKASVEQKQVVFIKGDIRNIEDCLKASAGCDIILHQAALGSVPRSIEKPLETHATNVTGFINMLEAAKRNHVSRFVYASSSSVYGDDTTLPKVEEKVGNPLSPYAVSKKTNELYAAVFAKLHNMEIIGLRYFNVFGPKQNPSGPYAAVIPIFVNKLLKQEACSIFGDGENRRDFTYVANVVQANLHAALTTNPSAMSRVFNIAFGTTMTINELYAFISHELNSGLEVKYSSPRPGEIKDSFADIAAAKKEIGYEPESTLQEAIKQTIAWYKNNRYS